MNGDVFECYDEQSDRRQFAKTVEALEGHVKKSLTFSEDVASLFLAQSTLPTAVLPIRPAEPAAGYSDTDTFIWHEELKDFPQAQANPQWESRDHTCHNMGTL
jgi:hypothetical protein